MSKAKSVLGKDLMLFIDGKAIALATSCKLGFRLKQSTHKVKIRVSGRKRTLKNFLGTLPVKTYLARMQMRIATINYSLCSWRINLLF